mgnify:CR=1 FL=1
MNSTKIRVISAATLVLILILTYMLFQQDGLQVVGFLITAVCIYEYNRLCFLKLPRLWQASFCLFAYANFLIFFQNIGSMSIHFIILSFLFLLVGLLVNLKDVETSITKLGLGLIGFVYVGILPAIFCRFFLKNEDGIFFLILTLISVTSTDIFAYFFGRWKGKTPLHTLSPKKTLEGAIAGTSISVLLTMTFTYFFKPEIFDFYLATAALVASMVGQIGDLFESLLKRYAQVKDSGKIMPGHGGALDRIDSLLFASPIFYFYYTYVYSTFV